MLKQSYQFSRQQRLIHADEFQQMFRAGRRLKAPSSFFLVKPNQLKQARLGFIVAKKNVRLATKRNYIKRYLRELFRLHQYNFSNLDIVWVAQQGLSQLDKSSLKNYLDKQWQKLLMQYATH